MKHSIVQRVIMLLFVVLSTVTAWALSGSGTQTDPYIINSTTDWNSFASSVTNGTTYEGKFVKLNANITVTTMAGGYSSYNYTEGFRGTFDGAGHTLTVNYGTDDSPLTTEYTAPFRTAFGATFRFLHVAGRITTKAKGAGGLIGCVNSSNNDRRTTKVLNCQSSVIIKSLVPKDGDGHAYAYVGGFIVSVNGYGVVNFKDCLYDGKLLREEGHYSYDWGGFAAGCRGTMTNCLYDPMSLEEGESSLDIKPFVEKTYATTLNNCQEVKGRNASDLVAVLGQAWQVSGNKAVPILSDKNLGTTSISGLQQYYPYTGGTIAVGYTLSDCWGNTLTKGVNYTESFSPSPVKALGDYTMTLTGKGSYSGKLTAKFTVVKDLEGAGTSQEPYIITNIDQWNTMALYVERGYGNYPTAYYKLGADISGVTTMVGTSSNKFRGTFDGDGHTLTISLGTSSNKFNEDYAAPFRYTDGATIKFLHVAGDIYTQKRYVGGLLADPSGTTTIQSCQVSVAIHSSYDGDGTTGGFIGLNNDTKAEITLNNCLFDGQLLQNGNTTHSCGGFVGWHKGMVYFNNCLFAPSSTITLGTNNSATFSRNGINGIENSYYTTEFNDGTNYTEQGTAVGSMTNDQLKTALGSGWKVEGGKVVPIMNGYNLSSATISMAEYYKWKNGAAVNVDYTVKDAYGTTLTKNTHYSVVIRNSNNIVVNSVTATDVYTLTITGISPYSGSQSKTFEVSENLKEDLNGYVFEKDENGRYLIQTKADLNRLSAYTNAGNKANGKTFIQTSNIDFEPADAWNKADSEEDNFNAIGEFRGTYDGQGYSISGIRIHKGGDKQGLFAINYGTIKSVKIVNARIVGNKTIGTIVGDNHNGTVTDCFVGTNVYLEGAGGYCGGIAGQQDGNVISGCVCLATVNAKSGTFAGGINGINYYSPGNVVKDNIAIGVIVSGGVYSNDHGLVEGAIVGRNLDIVSNNYYVNSQVTCVPDKITRTSNVGEEMEDVNGAREAYVLNINSTAISLVGNQNTYPTNQITTFSDNNVIKYGDIVYAAKGTIVKLASSINVPSGYHLVYTAIDSDNNPVVVGSNGEFTMPASNVSITGVAAVPDGKEAIIVNGGIVNGSVVSNKKDAVNGETITLTITPNAGYVMTNIVVTNAEGNVSIAGPDAQFAADLGGARYYTVNKLTFTMGTSATTIDATFKKIEELNYINMPHTGDTKSVNIPSSLVSFKVYDNSGKDGYYFTHDDGKLLLTAPEGYVMKVTGYVKLFGWSSLQDYLDIYDGNSTSSEKLGQFWNSKSNDTKTRIPVNVTSSSNQLFLHFVSDDSGYVNNGGGVYLTVTICPDINLADNASNATVIAENDGRESRVTLADRKLYKDGNWNTLCLPFDVDVTSAPLAGNGVVAKVLDADNSNLDGDGKLTLKFNTASSIPAGTPFIIKWTNGSDIINPVFNAVTINANAATSVAFTDNSASFVGTFSPFDITTENRGYILLLTSGGKLGYSKVARTLGSCRAYFETAAPNATREFIMNFGDDENTTGIIELSNAQRSTSNAQYYDLQGRKVANPTKGLYVVNGKKVVIK